HLNHGQDRANDCPHAFPVGTGQLACQAARNENHGVAWRAILTKIANTHLNSFIKRQDSLYLPTFQLYSMPGWRNW
ncbi:MAG: hypothetical protein ACI9SC_002012, partial [Gammaproteobacteria bacterium]